MSRSIVRRDPWTELRAFTPARLALGRSGASLPTEEVLRFGLAHAQARDAVHLPLDADTLETDLRTLGVTCLRARSAVPDRATYLLRPDLGRRLHPDDARRLREQASGLGDAPDLLLVIGDGLSSLAVQRNAAPIVARILARAEPGWRIGPVVIASQARVALGDDIGEAFGARFVAVLIGERPGLGSPDSLGVYLTAEPQRGRMDAERNCLSNIREAGMAVDDAARRLWWLCREARRLGGTGTGLHDASDERLPAPDSRDGSEIDGG
jgi:ethanolamine ammonia-lyase small subunit